MLYDTSMLQKPEHATAERLPRRRAGTSLKNSRDSERDIPRLEESCVYTNRRDRGRTVDGTPHPSYLVPGMQDDSQRAPGVLVTYAVFYVQAQVCMIGTHAGRRECDVSSNRDWHRRTTVLMHENTQNFGNAMQSKVRHGKASPGWSFHCI